MIFQTSQAWTFQKCSSVSLGTARYTKPTLKRVCDLLLDGELNWVSGREGLLASYAL